MSPVLIVIVAVLWLVGGLLIGMGIGQLLARRGGQR